jgi:pimeloyl-ACP methyl ester carboxylesterase
MQASINGVQLHYEDTGRGPPVVWLHGLMGSIARQRRANEGLDGLERRGFRLIAYDALGHGESGFTENEADYSWAAHAEILSALLQHLGIDRTILGGGSMGAGVSLSFALDHPDQVHKLVLVAPPPLADTFEPAQQLFNGFATLIETQGIEKAVEVAMQLPQFAELKDAQPEEYAEVRDWLLSQRSRAVVPAIRGLLNGPPLPENRFREIEAPALIVAHPDDPIHPQSSGERLHADIAGSRLIVAPEAMYYQEHHDELLEAIAAFLQGED